MLFWQRTLTELNVIGYRDELLRLGGRLDTLAH